MFKNLLKITLINFIRHKLFSLINVVGLGIGLSCCLIIALFVSHELSYEKQYRFASRLYLLEQSRAQSPVMSDYSSFLAAPLLVQDFPELEQTARYAPRTQPAIVAFENRKFREEELKYADSSFLELYDFIWLAGDPSKALQEPQSIVLTESFARKYFGSADALGKTLLLDDQYDLQVTGVIADLPENTHLEFTALSTIAMFQTVMGKLGVELENWNSAFLSTYLLLREGAAIASVQEQLPAFSARHLAKAGNQRSFNLRPITEIYLSGNYQEGTTLFDNKERVELFAGLAFCILVIAIINFMNLSTARSAHRAREVGVKLSLGASKAQLVGQFLGESIFMAGCAMLLAVAIVELGLPVIGRLTGLDLASQLPALPLLMAALAGSTLVIGAVAGIYPAHFLSGYQPSKVLKGELTRGRAGELFRKALVVFQFIVSIVLIIATVVIFQQMQLARDIDTGFQREQVFNIQLPYSANFDIDTRWPSLQAALLADSRISSVTHSTATPLMQGRIGIFVRKPNDDARVRLDLVQVETGYLQLYDIALLAGAYFTDATADDGLIINELAARQLGWSPAEAVGNTLAVNDRQGTVIGVVANTIHSVREESLAQIYSTFQHVDPGFAGGQLSLLLAASDIPGALDHIEQVWQSQFPNETLQGTFLDDQFDAQYQAERAQGQLFASAALLAVLVACFGLFGLASFNVECRIKEIGVRKVMGGSVWSIVLLLTNDFSRLVLFSNLIAWPFAYLAMNRWLENFAYRIDLAPLIFIGSGLIALCIAWVTIGGTAAKAASAKPVLALRYE